MNMYSNTQQTADGGAEERARQWWQERYGEPMPEEVAQWVKQQTRAEARRLNIAASMLSPQRMARIEDARRLAETKLRNIESSLGRLHDQMEWLGRFKEKRHELTEHKNRLYEVNKRLAMVVGEEKELERFEEFETVQGLFQRMTLLERQSRQNKLVLGELTSQLEEAQREADERERALTRQRDDCRDATRQMMAVRDQLEEANRIVGAGVVLELDERTLEELAASVAEERAVVAGEISEHEERLALLQEQTARTGTQRQAMEPHQTLMEHGEAVLTRLDRLYELRQQLAQLNRQQQHDQRQQQQENEMLGRVFGEYQEVEQNIKTLTAELHLHRQNNLGRSSYALQERAMQLKSRRQMLISAQSLWNRIALGYQLIEEKTQRVNQLRLSLDNLRQGIEGLEAKVEPMRKLCHEKEYTLTLSKSQNVIQLRGDLKEGISCTVCGATHHPYHSDTMLEQSKLIGELRTDYELLQAELIAKEDQLRQLQLQLSAETARRDVEEEALSRLRQRQMEDVAEWGVFSSLDRSFGDCSSSTNLEARTALLRQLIENTAYDADDAQKELDEYNFNQTRINEITEELDRQEQRRSELTVRLNEVNTGCQVLARQAEQTRQTRVETQERYTQLHEELSASITLNDWLSEWEGNHEGLRMRIEGMMESWQRLNGELDGLRRQREVAEATLESKRNFMAYLDGLALQVRDAYEQRRTMRKEGEKTYETMLGDAEVKDFFDRNYQTLLQARKAEEENSEEMQRAALRLAEMRGRQQELVAEGHSLAEEAVGERSRLDVWMRKFNASHPPVQYAELERAFAVDKDWNALRERVRGVRIEAMLEEARVDALRSAIVALQAEGMSPSNADEAGVLESLVAQQKQLEKQRQEVLMQLAEQRIALHTHEECAARLKAEEEERYKRLT